MEGASGEDDRVAIEAYPGYSGAACSACPHDLDGDGDVDVQDRNALGSQDNDSLATAGACIVVSGTAYQRDGVTAITGKVLTIAARVNGAGTYSTLSDSADGTWKFPGIVVAPSDAVALFLDGEIEEANLTTTTNGSNNIAGASMIENFLVIRSDDGSNGTTNTDVAYFDNDDNALEMLFTANGGSLVMEAGMGLRVETGGIFTPGGTVDVDTGGIQIAGTWNATGSEAISVEGDWTLTGTFNAASSTVTIAGGAGGTSTITGTNTFYNLTCTTRGRTLTFPASTTTTVSNILTLEGNSITDVFLRSSSSGTPFTLSVGGSFQDNAGNGYMDYIDVQDCTAAGSATSFLAFDAVNSGNNTNWYFNTVFVDTIADISDNVTTSLKDLVSDAGVPNGDGAVSFREALTAVAANDTILFDTTVFPSGTPATIDVDTSALPTLSASSVTIDASDAGVMLDDTDGDLAAGVSGLVITGSSNTIYGLQIKNFDADAASHGVSITGSTNTIGGTGAGQALTITGNGGAGINVATATVDNAFRANLIYDNTGIAIDLIGTANNSIAAPTIETAVYNCSSQVEVIGSGAAASATIDVYSNSDGDTDCLHYEGSTTADGSGNFTFTKASLTGSSAVAVQTDASGDSSEVSNAVATAYIAEYCYDTYASGWSTTPGNMTDCSTATYARTTTDTELQELTAHTIELGCGGSSNRAKVTPVFGGSTNGDIHDPGAVLTTTPAWISWIDITTDTNAPGTWTWSDVTNLDLDINAVVFGGKLQVYKVELRVTYTP